MGVNREGSSHHGGLPISVVNGVNKRWSMYLQAILKVTEAKQTPLSSSPPLRHSQGDGFVLKQVLIITRSHTPIYS